MHTRAKAWPCPGLLQRGETRPDLLIQGVEAGLQVLPHAFHRVQLGAVGGQPHQDDVLRDWDALRHMRRGLIEQDNVQALRIVLPILPQQDGEAVRIEAGQLPPEGLPRGGLHGRIEPVILIQGRDELDRLHAVPREATADGHMQAQATFILAEDPHGSIRLLPA
jgi:hypothetical protein